MNRNSRLFLEVPLAEGIHGTEHQGQLGNENGSPVTSGREHQVPTLSHVNGGEVAGIVGHNSRMRQIYEVIRRTASCEASVLIEGESGTGKDLIAQALHRYGNRACRPFLCINCAAIPPELIESELFGYKRGAFSGATCDKRGLIETVSGGTLFLDEIAEMPPHLQPKLLRVLQQRKLRRLGEEREIDVDFRLLSATNRDPSEAIQQGVLRSDLFYRISTIRIKVPPLRERSDDLLLIARHFVTRYSLTHRRHVTGISEDAEQAILRYSWPGNVRELENAIECAVLFCSGDQLSLEDLPESIQAVRNEAPRLQTFGMSLEEIERRAIELTIEQTGGNIKKAAEILKLPRQTLYRKLRIYNFERRRN